MQAFACISNKNFSPKIKTNFVVMANRMDVVIKMPKSNKNYENMRKITRIFSMINH